MTLVYDVSVKMKFKHVILCLFLSFFFCSISYRKLILLMVIVTIDLLLCHLSFMDSVSLILVLFHCLFN